MPKKHAKVAELVGHGDPLGASFPVKYSTHLLILVKIIVRSISIY